MSSSIVTIFLWIAALSSGLMAGVYFAFSGFIMRAFGNIDTKQSVAAMNSINDTILRSTFMPLFFGSTIMSVLLIIAAVFHWGEAGFELMLIAGSIYFVGMFACTVFFNVPLNNLLMRVDPDSINAHQVWARYLKNWKNWNHLRTVSSFVSCILCVWLLSSY